MTSVDIINLTSHATLTNYSTKWEVLKECHNLIEIIRKAYDKKIWDFELLYQILIEKLYMLECPILIRYFLIATINEINIDFDKNNKPYRINFCDNTYNHFVAENVAYYKKNNLYNEDDTPNIDKIRNHFNYLKKLVRTFTRTDQLYLMTENIETDLHGIMQ